MNATPQHHPDQPLTEAVSTALAHHGIQVERHGPGGSLGHWLTTRLPDGAEIAIEDGHGYLPGTLAQYGRLRAIYQPARHEDAADYATQVYRSPTADESGNSLARFIAHIDTLATVIIACHHQAEARALWVRPRLDPDRLTPAHSDTRTTARLHRAADRTTSLTVTTTVRMDAQALAAKLHDAYWSTGEDGEALPTLTRHQVLDIVGRLADDCADGWHQSMNGPGERAHDQVTAWADAQIRRLFPELTWPQED
ncbi:hypothetical protein [Kitasatospora sp. NPDC057541]|uniref:hypothetical protein n=1 Tax=unclassified Kitasatospora TaxID=2633591 RepID=UPI0036C21554